MPAKEIIVILFVSIRILEYTSPPLFFISVKETCIKRKFGKNALVKGMDLQEDATAMTRNNQIGGHKA